MRFIAVVAVLISMTIDTARASDLKVAVEGVRSDKGTVMVALFGNASAFEADDRFAGAFVTASPGRVVFAFPELEKGIYAVSVFHDENGNGALDTNFLGVPSEGYGFSNGATGFAGPPDFSDATFSVDAQDKTIELTLNY